jgi:phage head maturation protease
MFSSVQRAQDVRTKIREGILSAVSFGYDILKSEPGQQEGTQLLKELRLHEVSIVPWGANPKAQVAGVKSQAELAAEAAAAEAAEVKKALGDLYAKAALAAMTSKLRF